MTKEKLEKLKKLLEVTNEGLTEKKFLESFKTVVNQILKLETKALDKINKAIAELESKNNTSLNATQADLRALGGKLEELVDKALKEQANSLNFIRDKVRKIKEGVDGKDGIGVDGKDADEEKIINEVLGKIKVPGIDKTEMNEMDIELKALREELEKVKLMRGKGGGGTSAIGIANAAKYWVKTEEPSGLINGVNKAYAVSKTIFAVLSFSLNGEFIAQIPNYTISNKTVTFTTALPAAYSGKDFEITYV